MGTGYWVLGTGYSVLVFIGNLCKFYMPSYSEKKSDKISLSQYLIPNTKYQIPFWVLDIHSNFAAEIAF